jgi:hypothetical protein
MAAFGRDIRFILNTMHRSTWVQQMNWMSLSVGRDGFCSNWQFMHHPHRNVLELATLGSSAKIKLMISLQRKHHVDLTNITLILQESSGLSLPLPRVIEPITLGNKRLLLSRAFLNTSHILSGNKNKLLGRK